MEDLIRKIQIHIETTEECIENTSLPQYVVELLEADNKLLNEVVVNWQAERMYSEEEMLEFSEWVSHNDWVYLPSKGYWVNEEQEELEENFTTKELFEQFKKR